MIDELHLEATAIHEELEARLKESPDVKDFLLMTYLSDYEKQRVFAMLRAAIVDGFRLGLEYQWELRKEVTS